MNGRFLNECIKSKNEKNAKYGDDADYKTKYFDHLKKSERALIIEEKDYVVVVDDYDEKVYVSLTLVVNTNN